jgi:hypothetical protein
MYVTSYAIQKVMMNVTKIYSKPAVKCVSEAVLSLKKKAYRFFIRKPQGYMMI